MVRSLDLSCRRAERPCVAVICFIAAIAFTEPARARAASKQEVINLWTSRQSTIRSARFKWKADRFYARGSLSIPGIDDFVCPATDTVFRDIPGELLVLGTYARYGSTVTRIGPPPERRLSLLDYCYVSL